MKTNWIIYWVILWSCQSPSQPDDNSDSRLIDGVTSDTVQIDLKMSNLYWKGTKICGLGKHEGSINISDLYLLTSENKLVGGKFIIDMTSIEVTDIPVHEPIPRKRLVDHLKSKDFFDVTKYPTVLMEIIQVQPLTDSLQIFGNLNIKEITKPITFKALSKGNRYTATIHLDRFLWNIAYEGNILDRTLVERNFELKVNLMIQPN